MSSIILSKIIDLKVTKTKKTVNQINTGLLVALYRLFLYKTKGNKITKAILIPLGIA
jgi:hypothetical protein